MGEFVFAETSEHFKQKQVRLQEPSRLTSNIICDILENIRLKYRLESKITGDIKRRSYITDANIVTIQ